MRLLRHEAGHAVDTAFRLHARADWREQFGLRSQPYRRTYRVDPSSREFVRYLPRWYAQSHPAEDFAETFAVWLDRRSKWRARYPQRTTGARRKLEYVERLMRELVAGKPALRLREKTEAIERSTATLGEHYRKERRLRAREPRAPYSAGLTAIFSARRGAAGSRRAASELVRLRGAIRTRVRGPYRRDEYSIDQVLEGMMHECRQGALHMPPATERRTIEQIARLVQSSLSGWHRGTEKLSR